MSALPVVVVGGGVAGCAAAVAAADAGAATLLIEATHQFGGVAVHGEHRTLCGLAAIDAATPDLLEPDLTSAWIPLLTSGAPFRQGRVWLWPTTPQILRAGLQHRLGTAGVTCWHGAAVERLAPMADHLWLRLADGRELTAAAVIDASGGPLAARLLGLACAAAQQWPAHRSLLHLPALADGTAARVAALRTAQRASGGDAALALVPVDPARRHWQLSLDVRLGSTVADAATVAARIADALGGEVVTQAITVAERDAGRPLADLDLPALFAEQQRGLCWAAWPREEHGADGVAWTWPSADRHGIPERAVRIPGAPTTVWCVGKGAAVTAAAAAALRVTGTCLAIGGAVGRRAAKDE